MYVVIHAYFALFCLFVVCFVSPHLWRSQALNEVDVLQVRPEVWGLLSKPSIGLTPVIVIL